MPQMSPMNWSIIMMTTSWMITLSSMMNYSYMSYQKNSKSLPKIRKSSWKW